MDKIKIILDTDIGSDCDDAGALAILHNFADSDKAEIKAVVHCGSEISGAVAVKAINTWYQRSEIPVGKWNKSVFLEGETYRRYTSAIMEEYLKSHSMPEFEDSVRVLRRTLAENNGITIVVTGMLNNIAELLKSGSDDISPMSGIELVKNSVKDMYVMGGNFLDLSYAEFNILTDTDSARFVAEKFPIPITYCGYELGENVLTGRSLKNASDEHPVKLAYKLHSHKNNSLRFSWDPITVYCAVEKDSAFYKKSEKKTILFDEKGRVIMRDNGKDCYMIASSTNEEIQAELEKYMI